MAEARACLEDLGVDDEDEELIQGMEVEDEQEYDGQSIKWKAFSLLRKQF